MKNEISLFMYAEEGQKPNDDTTQFLLELQAVALELAKLHDVDLSFTKEIPYAVVEAVRYYDKHPEDNPMSEHYKGDTKDSKPELTLVESHRIQ